MAFKETSTRIPLLEGSPNFLTYDVIDTIIHISHEKAFHEKVAIDRREIHKGNVIFGLWLDKFGHGY